MNPARIVALVVGLVVLAVNASSVIVVLIVPRSGSSLIDATDAGRAGGLPMSPLVWPGPTPPWTGSWP